MEEEKIRNLAIVGTLILTSVLVCCYILPSTAIKSYGYSEGDEYSFTVEVHSRIITSEGDSNADSSSSMTIKIDDIKEDEGGYSIKIEYILVGSAGYWSGGYVPVGESLVYEGVMEGDAFILQNGSPLSAGFVPANMFTTTEWDDRGDQWDDYWDNIDDQSGYKVTEASSSGGAFTAFAELDVDNGWDYDGDGDKDDYTGTLASAVNYDGNGVLASSAMEFAADFKAGNRMELTYSINRGGGPALSSEFVTVIVGIIALVVGFAVGFLIKGRKGAVAPTM